MTEDEAPIAIIPPTCDKHNRAIIGALGFTERDPWRVGLICAGILLFQHASSDEAVWKRAGGETENLTVILAEFGCLACHYPDTFRRVKAVLRKGLDHAALVSRGKRLDIDWPLSNKFTKTGDA